jgi:hypothetical protein
MLARSRTERRRSWLGYLATLTALLIGAACGGDSTPPQFSEAGTYNLTSVNGQTLPVTITGTTLGTVVIQSATLALTSGNPSTFSATINGTVGGSASMTLASATGTYVRSGTSLTFNATGSPIPFTGTVDNNGHVVVALPGQIIGTSGTLQLALTKS